MTPNQPYRNPIECNSNCKRLKHNNYFQCFHLFTSDPNIWPFDLDSSNDRTKGRFESVVWPQYDQTQRKYLMLGMSQ
jgi:hypothetical protein